MRARPDGIEIAYTDRGEGLPLLFVHGFPLCRRAWAHQVAAFSPGYRVLAPDLRGLGESALGPGEPGIGTYAADLVELLRHLATGPAVLVGHSMGGYVALAFARSHPELLRGLVLVATRSGADSPEAAEGRRTTAAKVLREGALELAEGMVPKMLAPGREDPALRADVLALMAPSAPEGVAAALRAMAARPDATPSLAAIQVPTLVVTGDADTLIPPAESERMAAAIPHAKLVTIPGAGHLVAHEEPVAFNSALGDWLATTRLS
ncbi:MAG: alpha/beta fold hydrolase [Thermoanaerobaculia bacterium]|nr:alpha/beta fold hydrolase [Thermoanaerobaculia bacterium]